MVQHQKLNDTSTYIKTCPKLTNGKTEILILKSNLMCALL